MAAGLTVGKPDDRFSIADSALGRSSVVSMTTAGVTEFSEVSQITDTDDVCSNAHTLFPGSD